MDSLKLELDQKEVVFKDIPPKAVTFVRLPRLGIGRHHVTLTASANGREESGQIDVVIREPRSEQTKGAIHLSIEPVGASFEEFVAGQTEVDVWGPRGQTVLPRVKFFRSGHPTPIKKTTFDRLRLPVNTEAWDKVSKRSFEKIYGSMALANRCEAEFDAGPLGVAGQEFHREFTPLRWHYHRSRRQSFLTIGQAIGVDA